MDGDLNRHVSQQFILLSFQERERANDFTYTFSVFTIRIPPKIDTDAYGRKINIRLSILRSLFIIVLKTLLNRLRCRGARKRNIKLFHMKQFNYRHISKKRYSINE